MCVGCFVFCFYRGYLYLYEYFGCLRVFYYGNFGIGLGYDEVWIIGFVVYCVIIGIIGIVYDDIEFWYSRIGNGIDYFGVIFNDVVVFWLCVYYKVSYIV